MYAKNRLHMISNVILAEIQNIMAWSVHKKLTLSKLISNLTLREDEVTPIEGEVLHVEGVDEAEEGEGAEKVEEEEISKLTANRRLKAKVGKFKHSLLSLLPKRKILLHFLTRVCQLKILQTKTFSKVSYKDNWQTIWVRNQ